MQIFLGVVKTVIVFVIFTSCLENLISSESNRKLFRFLNGLIVLCIIIGKFDEILFGLRTEFFSLWE